jgi:EAL domain-containing protein (putative c-di-GMP-specific phosphodiesterase class I)
MENVDRTLATLNKFAELGVRIAIDDFGSAYANHSDLQRLPLDYLKVDRGELAASDDEDYRSWLLEAILVLGRDLSLTVIAKGIENEEQMSTLHAMGCAMAQGPFMGAAAPAKAIEGLFDVKFPAGGGSAAGDGELPTVDPREVATAATAPAVTAPAAPAATAAEPTQPS